MAISRGDLALWQQLKGRIPFRPSVLEIGEANWFGDVSPSEVPGMDGSNPDLFALGKAFYRAVLDYSTIISIDMNGTPAALKLDLNQPIPLKLQYDIVINSGTVEHVFDQRTLFQSIHDRTKPGGLMVHVFPVAGCTDHGFYTYSPCLIRELDRANGYRLEAACEVQQDGDKLAYIAWRKTTDAPFRNPQQGECRGVLGGEFRAQ